MQGWHEPGDKGPLDLCGGPVSPRFHPNLVHHKEARETGRSSRWDEMKKAMLEQRNKPARTTEFPYVLGDHGPSTTVSDRSNCMHSSLIRARLSHPNVPALLSSYHPKSGLHPDYLPFAMRLRLSSLVKCEAVICQ